MALQSAVGKIDDDSHRKPESDSCHAVVEEKDTRKGRSFALRNLIEHLATSENNIKER